MKRLGIFLVILLSLSMTAINAKPLHHKRVAHHKSKRVLLHPKRFAMTKPVPIGEIDGYSYYPRSVKTLIQESLNMSQKKLTYQFGSSNPNNGGLDCSGAIYYLLNATNNLQPPRQASELYKWVENEGDLHRVSSRDFESSDFNKLKPGDLLFWSGTYKTTHKPAITHVMLYLGKNKDNQPLMFGASGNSSYGGKRLSGVSVFDFKLPRGQGPVKFVGYGCIPNVTCA